VTDEVKWLGDVAYREAGPAEAPVALFVHGYPQSSYMWRHLLPPVAEAGWRGVAPDMPGFGNSPPFLRQTWKRHVEAIEEFRQGLDLGRVALVAHDWGGLSGLRWACDNPDAVRALVLSNTNFFPDYEMHELGHTLRTEGEGERFLAGVTREGFEEQVSQLSRRIGADALDDYFKAYDGEERRRAQLELWRSLDLEQLEPYQSRMARLGVPAFIFWGALDPFLDVETAHRFHRELPNSTVSIVEDAGHFVFEDAPERAAQEISAFLSSLP
jgi:haloalkane dehalogenase